MRPLSWCKELTWKVFGPDDFSSSPSNNRGRGCVYKCELLLGSNSSQQQLKIMHGEISCKGSTKLMKLVFCHTCIFVTLYSSFSFETCTVP